MLNAKAGVFSYGIRTNAASITDGNVLYMKDGQKLTWGDSGSISADVERAWVFYDHGPRELTVQANALNVNASSAEAIRINGVGVLRARRTGWGAPSGSFLRAAYTTYSAPSSPDVKDVADKLEETSRVLAALINDCRYQGFIGD